MRQKSYRPEVAQRAPVYHFSKASHTHLLQTLTYTLKTEKATAGDILGLNNK